MGQGFQLVLEHQFLCTALLVFWLIFHSAILVWKKDLEGMGKRINKLKENNWGIFLKKKKKCLPSDCRVGEANANVMQMICKSLCGLLNGCLQLEGPLGNS